MKKEKESISLAKGSISSNEAKNRKRRKVYDQRGKKKQKNRANRKRRTKSQQRKERGWTERRGSR